MSAESEPRVSVDFEPVLARSAEPADRPHRRWPPGRSSHWHWPLSSRGPATMSRSRGSRGRHCSWPRRRRRHRAGPPTSPAPRSPCCPRRCRRRPGPRSARRSRDAGVGIRTIVIPSAVEVSRGAPLYAERWFCVAPSSAGGRSVVVDPGGAAIVALGVTTPRDRDAAGGGVWLHHGGGDARMDRCAAAQRRSGPGCLSVRARAWGDGPAPATASGEPGRYRVDVLVGDGIRRIEIEVVNRSGFVPVPADRIAIVAVELRGRWIAAWGAADRLLRGRRR